MVQPQQWTEEQRQRYYQRYQQYQQNYPQTTIAKREQKTAHHNWLKITGVLLLLIILIAVVLFFALKEEPAPVETSAPQVPVAPVQQEVVQEELPPLEPKEKHISIVKSKFVEDFKDFEERSSDYYLDDQILLYTQVKDFQNDFDKGEFEFWLTHGITVLGPGGSAIDALSDPELHDVYQRYDGPLREYYFTATINALNLLPGEYTIVTTITDRFTEESVTRRQTFTLKEPETIRIGGPFFGEVRDDLFHITGKDNYDQGEQIPVMVQVRGFETEGPKADVNLNLLVYDSKGVLNMDLTKFGIYHIEKIPSSGGNVFNLNIYLDTNYLTRGIYWVEFNAVDRMAGTNHTVRKPVVIRGEQTE